VIDWLLLAYIELVPLHALLGSIIWFYYALPVVHRGDIPQHSPPSAFSRFYVEHFMPNRPGSSESVPATWDAGAVLGTATMSL